MRPPVAHTETILRSVEQVESHKPPKEFPVEVWKFLESPPSGHDRMGNISQCFLELSEYCAARCESKLVFTALSND